MTERGVHVVDTGDPGAVAVLLLHGIGSAAAAFVPQIEGLAGDGLRLIAWDAPGYAGSDDPRGPLGMDGYADAAAAVLDHLGIDAAHVVGVSWGGVIATRLALRHPDRVRRLVLADSTVGSGTDPQRAAAMRRRADELALDGIGPFAAARAPRLLSPAAPAELVDAVRRGMTSAVRLPGYRWATEAMAATDHTPDLHRIAAPTLVLVGEDDLITPPVESERLAAGIPGARLVTIPKAGHLANQERSDIFNAHLADFLVPAPDGGAPRPPSPARTGSRRPPEEIAP